MPVSTSSDQYNSMLPNVKKCRDVFVGEDAMRNETYLPQFKGESTDGYTTRKSMSYLNNKFADKISESCGLILGKGVEYEFENYITDDIDANGATLNQFTLELLRNGEIDGHSFILVDSPTATPETLQEQVANNIHPYWVNVLKQNVISWKIQGSTLTQAVIVDSVIVDIDEFTSETQTRFKVFNLIDGVVYYRVFDIEDNLIQDYTRTSFKEIPLVPFYTNRTAPMQSTPPFLTVANLNINTFQLSSQKQRALRLVADPDKAIFDDGLVHELSDAETDTGGASQTSLTFGADIVQVFRTDSRYEYVEPTGKGVELINIEIEKIEKDIDGQGAQINDRNITATEAEITNTKATSSDIIFSQNLEDALNRAYQITRQVDTSLQDTVIKLDRSFAKRELNTQTIIALNSMVLSGNLSKESMLKAITDGKLPSFITDEEINEEIARLEVAGVQ